MNSKSDSLNILPAQSINYEWFVPSVLAYNHRTCLKELSKTYMVSEQDEQLIQEMLASDEKNDEDSSLQSMFVKCIQNEME